MKLKLQRGGRGNRGNLTGIEVTSKININKAIVTSVTSVTSIIFLACRGEIFSHIDQIFSIGLPTLCKIEVTKVTEVTSGLEIAIFRLPLQRKVTSSYLFLSGRRPLYE